MKLGIVIAMQSEAEIIISQITNAKIDKVGHQKYYDGLLFGKNVTLALCGIGKVNSATATLCLMQKYNCDRFFNLGVVGGNSNFLKVGDLLFCQKAVYSDFDTSPIGDEVGFVSGNNKILFDLDFQSADFFKNNSIDCKFGVVASADSFTHNTAKVQNVYDRFGATCFDMEACAIAQVCDTNNLALSCLKCVCDYANEVAPDSYKMSLQDCAEKVQQATLKFIKEII